MFFCLFVYRWALYKHLCTCFYYLCILYVVTSCVQIINRILWHSKHHKNQSYKNDKRIMWHLLLYTEALYMDTLVFNVHLSPPTHTQHNSKNFVKIAFILQCIKISYRNRKHIFVCLYILLLLLLYQVCYFTDIIIWFIFVCSTYVWISVLCWECVV